MPLRFRILPVAPASSPEGEPSLAMAAAIGPSEERVFELASDRAEVRLGRLPNLEIELPFPAVSGLHARLFRGESAHEWWLEDQGSTNGTWLDGQRLAPRRPMLIRGGQRMRIGSVDILFEGWAATVAGHESTATIARRLINDVLGMAGNDVPSLALEAGQAAPAELRLVERDRRYVAGRAETCALVMFGALASREHAVFERRWDGVFVSDLGSRNGVRVNGEAIADAQRLHDGDSIQFGTVTVRLTDPEDRYLRRLESIEDDAPAEKPLASSPPAELRPPPPIVHEPLDPHDRPSGAARSPTVVLPAALATPRLAGTLSPGRKLAMALATAVLVVAVAGLIAILAG